MVVLGEHQVVLVLVAVLVLAITVAVVLVVKQRVVLEHILLGQVQAQDMGVLANVNLSNTSCNCGNNNLCLR